MTDAFLTALTVLAALGAGLVAGIFFAFSNFVMAALGRLRPDEGIRAMQTINVTVLNPWFFTAFFGTAAACAVLIAAALLGQAGSGAGWLISGGLLYLVGSILVTIAGNVPLNNALAAAAPDSAEGAGLWSRYLSVWTAWNHVRTAASLAAAAAFVIALF